MTPLETAFCVAFVLVCAIWLGILLLFMWTSHAPWSCLRDRRERLPHPNCRARVVQPHKYSRWFV
jgi:hypothetical protein